MFERLEVFLAIARNNNISKAADDLQLNQSKVSWQLRMLENELGVPLFDRVSRKVRLNKNGEKFRGFTEKMLADYDEVRRVLQGVTTEPDKLTIAAGAYFHAFFLPMIIPAFQKSNPLVEINIVTKYSDDLIVSMEKMEYEFAILATSHPIRSIMLHTDFSYEMPMLFICSPDNPLSEKKSISPDELNGETVILPLKGQNLYNYLTHNFKKHRIAFASEITMDTADAMKSAVSQNLGVTFLPRHAVQKEIVPGKLASVPVVGLNLNRKLVCVHNVEKPLSYAALDFIEHTISVIDHHGNYERSGLTKKNQEFA